MAFGIVNTLLLLFLVLLLMMSLCYKNTKIHNLAP